MTETHEDFGGTPGAQKPWWSYGSDAFFERVAPDLGVTELSESDRAWLCDLVKVAAEGRVRLSKSDTLRQLAAMRRRAIMQEAGKRGRGRPPLQLDENDLPSRVRWIMARHRREHPKASAVEIIDRTAADIGGEKRSPSRMVWSRYFVIHCLNAAWGRRFPYAETTQHRDKARTDSMTVTWDDIEEIHLGPFFRVVREILHQAGRADSDAAIASAILEARRSNFAL